MTVRFVGHGSGFQARHDESFGLDNLRVTIGTTPMSVESLQADLPVPPIGDGVMGILSGLMLLHRGQNQRRRVAASQ